MTRPEGPGRAARRARWAAVLACALVAGGSGGAWGAFRAATSTPVGTFSAAAVAAPPVVRAATVAPGATNPALVPGTFRQGGEYRLYAQVDDGGSGVGAVTAAASSFDTGVSAEPLTAAGGPWTVGGTSYSHRSDVLRASTPLRTGRSYPWSVTATDLAAGSTTLSGLTATAQTYAAAVSATAGLVAHYRLSDGTVVAEDFTAPPGPLTGRTPPVGDGWTKATTGAGGAVVTAAGRVRHGGTGIVGVDSDVVPPSGDYRVEADLHVVTLVPGDSVGVTARSGPFGIVYVARYQSGQWQLVSASRQFGRGVEEVHFSAPASLVEGATHRIGLEVRGTTVTLLVDGVPLVSITDSDATATGRGGMWLDGTTAASETTGLHLDDFTVTALATTMARTAAGSGGASGAYHGGTLSHPSGALVGDRDGAARFDGVDDDGAAVRPVQDTFSLEYWLRFPPGSGTGTGASWKDGAGLVGAPAAGTADDFGTSLRANGAVDAGVRDGGGYTQLTSGPLAADQWHHVVLTRDRATSVIELYVDGSLVQSSTAGTASLTAGADLVLGRLAGGHHYRGLLDEVAVYSTALDAATVADHHRAGRGTG